MFCFWCFPILFWACCYIYMGPKWGLWEHVVKERKRVTNLLRLSLWALLHIVLILNRIRLVGRWAFSSLSPSSSQATNRAPILAVCVWGPDFSQFFLAAQVFVTGFCNYLLKMRQSWLLLPGLQNQNSKASHTESCYIYIFGGDEVHITHYHKTK